MEEEEEEYFDEEIEEAKTNNIAEIGVENLKLEDYQARPDKITKVELILVDSTTANLKWEVPDSNNCPITQYIVK